MTWSGRHLVDTFLHDLRSSGTMGAWTSSAGAPSHMWKGEQWQRFVDLDEASAQALAAEISALLALPVEVRPDGARFELVVTTSSGGSFLVATRYDWQVLEAALT